MIDRLHGLRQLAKTKGITGIPLYDEEQGADTQASEDEHEPFMGDFFAEVDKIKESLTNIHVKLDEMRDLKERALMAVSAEKEAEISAELEALLLGITQSNLRTKKCLEVLKEENIAYEVSPQCQSAELAIRKNLLATLSKRFADTLTECQKTQTEYRQELKGKASRQIRMVYPEASDDEINQLVDDEGGGALQAIKSKMTGGHETLQNALADVYDKYRDVKRLEASVKELHEMFVELATLVDRQGQFLDSIEENVEGAQVYTEKAEKELVTARKWQVTAKKYMCCIILVLVILLLIILLPVLLTRKSG
eukprot:Platyproteum_vivax@DN7070_c0_g1_i1.p1